MVHNDRLSPQVVDTSPAQIAVHAGRQRGRQYRHLARSRCSAFGDVRALRIGHGSSFSRAGRDRSDASSPCAPQVREPPRRREDVAIAFVPSRRVLARCARGRSPTSCTLEWRSHVRIMPDPELLRGTRTAPSDRSGARPDGRSGASPSCTGPVLEVKVGGLHPEVPGARPDERARPPSRAPTLRAR
jgi:hypothetical protein